jgi:predicted nucleotidyltransferase
MRRHRSIGAARRPGEVCRAPAVRFRCHAVRRDAALDQQERELLDRLVAELRRVYGDDLDGVWLYGSRARGERMHDESDVDVLVVTRSPRDDKPLIPAV